MKIRLLTKIDDFLSYITGDIKSYTERLEAQDLDDEINLSKLLNEVTKVKNDVTTLLAKLEADRNKALAGLLEPGAYIRYCQGDGLSYTEYVYLKIDSKGRDKVKFSKVSVLSGDYDREIKKELSCVDTIDHLLSILNSTYYSTGEHLKEEYERYLAYATGIPWNFD